MRRRILIADGSIGRRGQDRLVPDYERADRNLVALRRIASEVKSVSNVLLVGGERLRARAERLFRQVSICRQALALSIS